MVLRSSCICDGKVIGIESIYTVINGRQINIPEKVEEIRKLGREGKLVCCCGCGARLSLVAGEQMLRRQHFRIQDNQHEHHCHLVEEGQESIDSKIVLKCWLEDKIGSGNIETRVQIKHVDDSNRKYEFSLLAREKKLAISYYHKKVNITDEKLDILAANSNDINILHVVDLKNAGMNYQYPESLMKIQQKQGFVLCLSVEGNDYFKSKIKAVYYIQDIDGFRREKLLVEDALFKLEVNETGDLIYKGLALKELQRDSMQSFQEEQENLKFIREQEELRRKEIEKQCVQQEVNKQEERRKIEEEKRRLIQLRIERSREQYEEQQKREKERKAKFFKELEHSLEQQYTLVKDPDGNRWVKCKICGKISTTKDFPIYGGYGSVNKGTCYECDDKKTTSHENHETERIKNTYDPNACPECGGRVVEKQGYRGAFMGCSRYPKCRYTRSVRKK